MVIKKKPETELYHQEETVDKEDRGTDEKDPVEGQGEWKKSQGFRRNSAEVRKSQMQKKMIHYRRKCREMNNSSYYFITSSQSFVVAKLSSINTPQPKIFCHM